MSTIGGAEVQMYLLGKELSKDKNLDIYFFVGDYGQDKSEDRCGIKLMKALSFKKNIVFNVV